MPTDMQLYNKLTKKRTKIRWLSVLVFFTVVMVLSFLPFIVEIDEGIYSIVLLVIIFGGGAVMLSILGHPYFNRIELPRTAEKQVDGKVYFGEGSVFTEELTLKLLYYLTLPLIALFAGFTFYAIIQEEHIEALSLGAGSLFFLLVIILFGRLSIVANSENVKIALGPLKTDISIQEIKSIIPTTIRPIRDYMGIGKRLGPDGAIGYIVFLKTGIRIELEDGKVYVVTMRKAQELTDFVRFFQRKK